MARRLAVCSLWVALSGLGCQLSEPAYRGPLEVRAIQPVHLTFLRMPSTRAVTQPGWEVSTQVNYTSLYQFDTTAQGDFFRLDGEILRAEVMARYGFGSVFEWFVAAPANYTTSGFLDHFIEDYHDAFGLKSAGRDEVRDDQWDMRLVNNGRTGYSMAEDELALGDISTGLGMQVLAESSHLPATLIRAAVELPTGKESDGFGNGEFDYGIGLTLEKTVGKGVFYAAGDYTFAGETDSFREAGIRVRNTVTAQLAYEQALADWYSALLQFRYESSPVGEFGPTDADDDQWLVTLGGMFDVSERTQFMFAFTEDIDGEAAPDFTVHAGLKFRF